MPTILIADEAGLFVALETSPVLRSGCNIVPVRTTHELLSRAATLSPDLLLLDAELLGRETRNCIRSLKSDRKLSNVPIVIAARNPAAFQSVLTSNDIAFAKPVSPEAVGAALKRLLPIARRRSTRVPVSISVMIKIGDSTIKLRTKDLGAGGFFLKTPREMRTGTRFNATFSLPSKSGSPGKRSSISATCEVIRRVDPTEHDLIPGVGAEFISIDDPEASMLKAFIKAIPDRS